MALLTIGINHRSAPLDVREALAFDPDLFAPAIADLLAQLHADEAVIMSTCNRTELYVVTAQPDPDALIRWLCGFRGVDYAAHRNYFYVCRGRETVRHSLRVAAGLDSMILGEPQILGQMKQALNTARDAAGTGPVISRLFEHSFAAAKQIRTHTDIGANPVSVAYAGAQIAGQIFADLSKQRALLVGAGETIELTARYLSDIGMADMIFANRSRERAEQLAARHNGRVIDFATLAAHLESADLLITSTAAPGSIVTAAALRTALRARRRKPIFALDLAVPRDIEPAAAAMEDVYLYTVDDLQNVIDGNMRARHVAAEHAESLIEARMNDYLHWMDSRRANDTIRALRDKADATRAETVALARQRLARGDAPEAVIEFLGNTLTHKLIHEPSATLRKASGARRQKLLRPARDLFALDDDRDNDHPANHLDVDPSNNDDPNA